MITHNYILYILHINSNRHTLILEVLWFNICLIGILMQVSLVCRYWLFISKMTLSFMFVKVQRTVWLFIVVWSYAITMWNDNLSFKQLTLLTFRTINHLNYKITTIKSIKNKQQTLLMHYHYNTLSINTAKTFNIYIWRHKSKDITYSTVIEILMKLNRYSIWMKNAGSRDE